MVAKTKRKNSFDLKGIEQISKYMGLPHYLILDMRANHGLPIVKINGKSAPFWAGNKSAIQEWLKGRGIRDSSKITHDLLEQTRLRLMIENDGLPKVGRRLRGIDQISKFFGHSLTTTYDLYRFRDDCPIKKNGNELSVDSDVFLAWLVEHNLITSREAFHIIEQCCR